MKLIQFLSGMGMVLLFLLPVFCGCEYEGPNSAWEKAKNEESIVPTIDRILPEDAGGASIITINGSNFSNDPEKVWVYADNKPCQIVECSETSISVYRPGVVGDSVIISVVVQNRAAVVNSAPYKLDAVVTMHGYFSDMDAIVVIAVDADEYVYATLNNGRVLKIDPVTRQPDESYVAEMFTAATDMKVGPDGALYFLRKQNTIYRLPPEGGSESEYAEFDKVNRKSPKAEVFDFDQNHNIFAGGSKTGLILLRPDLTQANHGIFLEYEITAIRIYNDYVYTAATYLGGDFDVPVQAIYRNRIESADGSVDPLPERVMDMSDVDTTGILRVNAITFSQEGDMFLGTNLENPLLQVKPDGEVMTYFYGLIPGSVDRLLWGNSDHLYALVNQNTPVGENGGLYRLTMGIEGAPDYGR